jgi:alpha-galactosidase
MRTIAALFVMLLSIATTSLQAADKKPIKVVILAGQSNMEGKAKVSLMDYQAQQPATAATFKHLRDGDQWKVRDDVFIKFLDRSGKLTVGFGSPNSIGPELELGQVLGDHFEEPVLLIKTAWGGRSLSRDFRPPSAGLPDKAVLEKLLANAQKRNPNATMDEIKQGYGASYRAMLDEVRATLKDIKQVVPSYEGQGYELIGFVWFQGWNDMISAEATAEYTANLTHFIHDVRKDFDAPKLPFVIGQMGVDGVGATGGVQKFKDAQAKVMEDKAFTGNVALVKTDAFWDEEAAAVFKKGWRQNIEAWNKVGSDFPFHYLGSAKTMLGIGHAFGEAVLELQ